MKQAAPSKTSNTSNRIPANQQLTEVIKPLFCQLLKLPEVAADANFFVLGGDSLRLAELNSLLQEEFGVSLPARELLLQPTPAGIAKLVAHVSQQDQSNRSQPFLLPVREQGDLPPLYLVHGAGGQVYLSPRFLDLLGNNRPVFIFQLPGLDGVSDTPHSIEALAARYLDALRASLPSNAGPFQLGGLCSGSFVTVEMARQLQESGNPLLPLLLIDPPFHNLQSPIFHRLHQQRALLFILWRKLRLAIGLPARARSRKVMYLHQVFDQQGDKICLTREHNRQWFDHIARTKIQFHAALARYQLHEFCGPVRILSSSNRLLTNYRQIGLTGDVVARDAGVTHRDLFNVENDRFVEELTMMMRELDNWQA